MDENVKHGGVIGVCHHSPMNYGYQHGNYGGGYRNDNCLDEVIANSVNRIASEIPEVKNSISDKINTAMSQDNANSRSIDMSICNVERSLSAAQTDLQKEIIFSRVESLKSECKLAEKIDNESDLIKERLNAFERSVSDKFCHIKESIKDSERRLLDRMTADKLDEKNNTIDELRHTCRHNDLMFAQEKSQLAFSSQISMLNSQIFDLSQNQRATNQAINFGTGSTGEQTNTNNQVK